MMQAVDSKKKQLTLYEIVENVMHQQGHADKDKKEIAAIYMALVQEMSMPDTVVKIFGNSLCVIHVNGDTAFFRMINADTAQNLIQNAIACTEFMRLELGIKKAVITYKGQSFRNLLRATDKAVNNDKYNYVIFKAENGDDVAVLYMKD